MVKFSPESLFGNPPGKQREVHESIPKQIINLNNQPELGISSTLSVELHDRVLFIDNVEFNTDIFPSFTLYELKKNPDSLDHLRYLLTLAQVAKRGNPVDIRSRIAAGSKLHGYEPDTLGRFAQSFTTPTHV